MPIILPALPVILVFGTLFIIACWLLTPQGQEATAAMGRVIVDWIQSINVPIHSPALERVYMPDLTIPIEETKPIDVAPPKSIPIAKPDTKTQPKESGAHNVYDVWVAVSGYYNDYTRGKGSKDALLPYGDKYKFGRTMYTSVIRRYEQFKFIPKEDYILRNLRGGNFRPTQWHLFRVSLVRALAKEAELITAYSVTHLRLPAGNTGLY